MGSVDFYANVPRERMDQIDSLTRRAYEENDDLKREDVTAIFEWLEKQPHLPKLLEAYVIAFLCRCRYNREKCKKRLDNFFTVRSVCPEIFSNRNPSDPTCRRSVEVGMVTLLPKPTPEGHKVIYCRMMDPDVKKYSLTEQLKNLDMVMFSLLFSEGFVGRYIFVIDQEGGTFDHLMKTDLVVAKNYAYYVQNAVPVYIKNVHVINPFPFIERAVDLAKLFFSASKMRKFRVHKTIETLYEYVPKDCLPAEYGGCAGSFKELHDNQKKRLLELADIFSIDEHLKADESKRVDKSKTRLEDDYGLQGTFRKLCLD